MRLVFRICLILIAVFSGRVLVDDLYAGEVKPGAIVAVPNVHGTVSGWLTDFNSERNYMANNYAANLEYLSKNPDYVLAISEVPNLIALEELRPDVLPILRAGLKSGRVELVNAFFDETDANLLLGETLVRSAVEGIHWQKEHYGIKPRFGWMIDSNGMHSQFAEILRHVDIDAFIYFRNSPVESPSQRWRASSGAEVLAFANQYAHWRILYKNPPIYNESLAADVRPDLAALPDKAPLLWLLSDGDYSMPPADLKMPEALLGLWHNFKLGRPLQFAVPSDLLSFYQNHPSIVARLPVITGETIYSYNAFWAAAPKAKQDFRHAEETLIGAESLAALMSVAKGITYPSCELRDAWWALLMNSDRALVWGAGSGDPYYGPNTWNVEDRNKLIGDRISGINRQSIASFVAPSDDSLTIINQSGVTQQKEVVIPGNPDGKGAELPCQKDKVDGPVHCLVSLDPFSARTIHLTDSAAPMAVQAPLPEKLVTPFYELMFQPETGALLSLSRKGSKTPILIGQEIRAERQIETPGQSDFLVAQPLREIVAAGTTGKPNIRISEGPLGWRIISEITWDKGAKIRRVMTLYRESPMIDMHIEAFDLPNDVLVSDNFRLSGEIRIERRGLPYGFTSNKLPRIQRTPERNLLHDHKEPYGINDRTVPVVRWSAHEALNGAGIAILDKGTPGRESNGDEASILLVNTASTYRGKSNTWLRGDGTATFDYSLLPYQGDWEKLKLPQRATAYGSPLLVSKGDAPPTLTESLLSSSDNFLVQSVRMVGSELEVRGMESTGKSGDASITLNLPYTDATRVDALGNRLEGPIHKSRLVSRLALKPQEIATLRFMTDKTATSCPSLTSLESLIPASKRAGLKKSDRTLTGHPPE